MNNKPLFPTSVKIFLSILVFILLIIVGGFVYFLHNPSIASLPGQFIQKYINHKVATIGHGIYLRTLQDPDKDKDGLTDEMETKVYKTDPKKFDSSGTGVGDGVYIYDIYKKAFDTNDESLLSQYRQNLSAYKQLIIASSSTSTLDFLGTFSLNDAFNLRALETYDFYVGVPDDVIQIVREALDDRQNGDYAKSLSLLQEASAKNPDSAILKYHLGLTYHNMKQYDKALSIYTAIENDPAVKSPLLYSDLASANYAIGNEDNFVHYMQLSIKEFPEDLNQYLSLSSYYQDKNQLDKAEEVLNQGLKIEPRYASFYNALAIISGLKGDNKTEFDLYKKAVSYDFRYAPGHLNLAILYQQYLDNPKDGLTEARIAYDLDPIPRHLAQVVLIYNALGNTTKAKELETQLLNMKNVDAGSFNDIGLMYLDQQNYKQAEIYFRKAIVADPKLSNAYNNLGIVLGSTNRNDESVTYYKKAIEINPNYANAYSNLGIYYTDKKDYQNAISSLIKASQLNPNLYRPYQNLGDVYLLMGDKEKAKFYYKKAVDLGDKDPVVIDKLKTLSQ